MSKRTGLTGLPCFASLPSSEGVLVGSSVPPAHTKDHTQYLQVHKKPSAAWRMLHVILLGAGADSGIEGDGDCCAPWGAPHGPWRAWWASQVSGLLWSSSDGGPVIKAHSCFHISLGPRYYWSKTLSQFFPHKLTTAGVPLETRRTELHDLEMVALCWVCGSRTNFKATALSSPQSLGCRGLS